MVDIWSRKVVAWDVEQSESAELAAQLVSRACLKERINSSRKQPLILHADNGSSMRAATLEVRLEELGGTQILLEAKGEQRQSLFRIAIPHR